jgi:hypothetical protein
VIFTNVRAAFMAIELVRIAFKPLREHAPRLRHFCETANRFLSGLHQNSRKPFNIRFIPLPSVKPEPETLYAFAVGLPVQAVKGKVLYFANARWSTHA